MKLGIQMWSINDVCMKEGLPKAFELIHDIGYEGFEFALGSHATLEELCGTKPEAVRRALEENDIQPVGTHLSLERLLEDPDPILRECVALGLPYAAIGPCFYADREPFEEQKKIYGDVTRIAKLFHNHGIQMQCHCSAFGYLTDYKGRRTVEGMFEEAGLENLQPEFDTAWMICGGVDPIQYLRKYSGHADVLHLKDFHPPLEKSDYILVRHNTVNDRHCGTAVGSNGIQDLGTILPTAAASGTKWVIVELWNESNSLENAEISLQNIKRYL